MINKKDIKVTPLSLLESLEKDVEGKKVDESDRKQREAFFQKPDIYMGCCGEEISGYNLALDEFLSLIKQYKEQLK